MNQACKQKWTLLLSLCLMTGLSGCATVYNAPNVNLPKISTTSTYPLTVNLVITKKFANTKLKNKMGGYVVPLGKTLVKNSISITQSLFRKVIVIKQGEPSHDEGADCTLTPRLVSIPICDAAWAFGNRTVDVMVLWTLTDPKGQIIWSDTISGSGAAKEGNSYTRRTYMKARLTAVEKSLFRNSYNAMASSPEIRSFAMSRQKEK